jgi:hypothetical protein
MDLVRQETVTKSHLYWNDDKVGRWISQLTMLIRSKQGVETRNSPVHFSHNVDSAGTVSARHSKTLTAA